MRTLYIVFFIFLFSSCIQKGEQNISGEGAPEDITISLLKISPPSVVIGTSETYQFSSVGGNSPYIYSITSGLGSIDQTGNFTASASVGTTTIKVTDSGGNSNFAVITIGSLLQISPASKTMGTSETLTLNTIGGVAPFVFSISSGLGSVDAGTGVFTSAVSIGNTTVEVRDLNNNVAYTSLTIVDALAVTPASITIEDLNTKQFTVTGGSAPYTYQVYAGLGTINASGLYSASASSGTSIIRIIDSNSNYVEATVTVAQGPNISVTDNTLIPGQIVTLSSSEGVAPFLYSIGSGLGTVNSSTGVYTAPAEASTTVIRCTDSNSFISELTLQTSHLKKVVIGDNFTCALQVNDDNVTSDLKCLGGRIYGEAGLGNSYVGDVASELGDNLSAIDFGTGYTPIGIYSSTASHRCAIFSNGKIKCWGEGGTGRRGSGNQTDIGKYNNEMGLFLPAANLGTGLTVGNGLSLEKRVSLGAAHTCVSLSDGSTKCFGEAAQGRSGNGNETDLCSSAGNCGDNVPALELDPGNSIVQLVAGFQHSCAIIAPANRVKCWGEGAFGRLGYEAAGDEITKPKDSLFVDLGAGRTATSIALGYYHSCALLDDNSVKCWGDNNYGQLGIGNRVDQGDNALEMGDNLQAADMGSVSFPIELKSAGYYTCAKFNNGKLKCWGWNGYGQLGQEHGSTKGDGANEMGDNLPFINIGTALTVSSFSLSYSTVCAITNLNTLKCWGDNNSGQLGIGSTGRIGNAGNEMGDFLQNSILGAGRTAIMVSVSNNSTCVLLDNSQVKCWGKDESGNLGSGNTVYGDTALETSSNQLAVNLGTGVYAKDLFAGRYHICAILMDDNIKCWGHGGNGRLGQGNSSYIGDHANEMGDNLSNVNLGIGESVKQGAGWENNTCVVTNANDLQCWGDGASGRTGHNNETDYGDGAGEMGTTLLNVDLGAGRSAKQVSMGNAFSCVLMDNNQIKCFGSNTNGRLGYGDTQQRGHELATANSTFNYSSVNLGTGRSAKQVSLGHEHACVLMDNDQVKCFGKGSFGRLGSGNSLDLGDTLAETGDGLATLDLGTGRSVKAITTGIYHSCALLDNSKVKCWGYNGYGQLGIGSTANMGDGASEMGDNLPYVLLPVGDKVVSIKAAGYTTCAVLESNAVKCWGRNQDGQLGQGHKFNVGTDALSMDVNLPISY